MIGPRAALLGVSSGRRSTTPASTIAPIPAKTMSGADRPSGGKMNRGAIAGPMIVPSPKEEASSASAPVRACPSVRAAT